jgi:hypothetical protein
VDLGTVAFTLPIVVGNRRHLQQELTWLRNNLIVRTERAPTERHAKKHCPHA